MRSPFLTLLRYSALKLYILQPSTASFNLPPPSALSGPKATLATPLPRPPRARPTTSRWSTRLSARSIQTFSVSHIHQTDRTSADRRTDLLGALHAASSLRALPEGRRDVRRNVPFSSTIFNPDDAAGPPPPQTAATPGLPRCSTSRKRAGASSSPVRPLPPFVLAL